MTLQRLREATEAGTGDGKWHSLCIDACLADHSLDVMRAYHGSLDAAKALHDALMPTWQWVVSESGAQVSPHGATNFHFFVANTNPARAWLVAILRALEATQEPTP